MAVLLVGGRAVAQSPEAAAPAQATDRASDLPLSPVDEPAPDTTTKDDAPDPGPAPDFPGREVVCNGSIAPNTAAVVPQAPNTFDLRLSCVYGPSRKALELAHIRMNVETSVGPLAFVVPIGSDGAQTQWNEGIIRNSDGRFRGAYPFRLTKSGATIQPSISLDGAGLAGCFSLNIPDEPHRSAEVAYLIEEGISLDEPGYWKHPCSTRAMFEGPEYPAYPTPSTPVAGVSFAPIRTPSSLARAHDALKEPRAYWEVDAISSNQFRSQTVVVPPGVRVSWTNTTQDTHAVKARGGGWHKNSKVHAGEQTSFSFRRSGTYRYRCTIHAGMTGKVIVA